MVTAVVAACAVLLACGVTLVAIGRARLRSNRRLESVLLRIDGHLESITSSVAQAVDSVAEARAHHVLPTLTLDFDDLVESLVAEAAVLASADAVVFRLEGPGGRPIIASIGARGEAESLDRTFEPPNGRQFSTARIDWTYSASGEQDDAQFRSALVLPLASVPHAPGMLTVYSTAPDAFRPHHAARLHSLIEDAAAALSNARRFAEIEARLSVDPTTGVPNRRGYQLELGREVARAHRTGRPLSVVLVGLEDADGVVEAAAPSSPNGIGELARLLARVTRRSDISCRRGERELAVLLPETKESGARVFTTRLRDEAARALADGRSTFTVGLVEWQPNETPDALDARVENALTNSGTKAVPVLDDVRTASTAVGSTVRSSLVSGADFPRTEPSEPLRRDALDTIARELVAAHDFGRSLALVSLDVCGLDALSARLGREAADSTLSQVVSALDEGLGGGSVHRLGSNEFALVLPGATIHDAETLVDALQSSLDFTRADDGVALSAGITELADGDDALGALDRANHALWQAKQAGPGTVVVASPSRRRNPRR
jgi:diguanylate cyclase (GGDEF)-like protein